MCHKFPCVLQEDASVLLQNACVIQEVLIPGLGDTLGNSKEVLGCPREILSASGGFSREMVVCPAEMPGFSQHGPGYQREMLRSQSKMSIYSGDA